MSTRGPTESSCGLKIGVIMKKKIYFAGNPYIKIHLYEREEEIYGVLEEVLKK